MVAADGKSTSLSAMAKINHAIAFNHAMKSHRHTIISFTKFVFIP